MQRAASSNKFPLGSLLPIFSLPDVGGREISSDYLEGGRLGLVVFSCNHCPYVQGSERMLMQTVREFEPRGLRTLCISSNDAAQYPEDSFENMKRKAQELALPYPYLYDESQNVAKLFDAACTPECYLFDRGRRLIYHGRINDNPKDPSAPGANHLHLALEQALSGNAPDPAYVHPLGCSIKWKP